MITIDAERYEELLRTEQENELIKAALFSDKSVRLSYNKTDLLFEPDTEVIKILCPDEYKESFKKLQVDNNV